MNATKYNFHIFPIFLEIFQNILIVLNFFYLFKKDVEKTEETAVTGTLNVLKACHSHQVKKCVVTGSIDTVVYVKDED